MSPLTSSFVEGGASRSLSRRNASARSSEALGSPPASQVWDASSHRAQAELCAASSVLRSLTAPAASSALASEAFGERPFSTRYCAFRKCASALAMAGYVKLGFCATA
jgi:ferric-dicitrate binding protein FerR (iron transport regulator)